MKNLRRKFDLYCYKNRNKGIPNLMLYIVLGTAIVYLMSQMSGNYLLYNILCFDRQLILQGQVWRLITYPLTYGIDNLLLMAVSLFCYYSLGRAMENIWGTLRFNLFYLTGVVMMDVYCMIFGGVASATYLNLSLFLSYATLFPNAQFLLLFIIPVKAWIFALFDLAIVLLDLFTLPFPYNLFSVISLANYFLFFGKETKGLPEDFLEAHRDSCIRLPMNPEARSLNLSNAVAITVYEALRQLNFPHLQKEALKKPSSAG